MQTLVGPAVFQTLIPRLLVVFLFLCEGQKGLGVGALSGFRGKPQGPPHLAFHHPGKENDLGSGVKVQGSGELQPLPSPLRPGPCTLCPRVGELI